jgi:hypothetical protein
MTWMRQISGLVGVWARLNIGETERVPHLNCAAQNSVKQGFGVRRIGL